jgi:hypothetical protein
LDRPHALVVGAGAACDQKWLAGLKRVGVTGDERVVIAAAIEDESQVFPSTPWYRIRN